MWTYQSSIAMCSYWVFTHGLIPMSDLSKMFLPFFDVCTCKNKNRHVCCTSLMIRDWSLITGRGGLQNGRGGHVKFYPYEKGGRKKF